MSYMIPFNRPCLAGNEYRYIAEAIANGHASGDGPFTQRCHELLERELQVAKVLLTTSCTHALEMAALLLECKPGDEIIVPSFAFVSTANAFALRGARIIFADIRRDTLNLEEACLESLITPQTKAIVVVHYAGVACEMDSICAIAQRHGIKVVEDNAHGLFARYKEKPTGTFGCLAAQSFHETKNLTCGEGGALMVNDPEFSERATVIRAKGTNRDRFLRGQVDKYTWVDLGSSYLPSDLLAAFLFAQLEARNEIQRKRRRVWECYWRGLQQWALENKVTLPWIPLECEQAYHMFYLILPSLAHRQALISHLKAKGILSVFHYAPLHLSDMGRRFGADQGSCPVTEDISPRLLRLPFYNDLTEQDQARVIAAVTGFSMQPLSASRELTKTPPPSRADPNLSENMPHATQKEAICSYLQWDSQFFGKRIACLNRPRLAETEVSQLLAWCAEQEIDCLYFLADSADARTTSLAEQNGFALVDLRVTVERAVGDEDHLSSESADPRTRLAHQRDAETLRRMARLLHHGTRFYFDGHFERSKCDLLYETWIDKSLNSPDQAVFVAESAGQVAGYISCQADVEQSRVGLLGVAEANARTGLGTALIRRFLAWSAERGARRATVVSQGRNVAAQRLYERCGFLTSSVQYWYHRWFVQAS